MPIGEYTKPSETYDRYIREVHLNRDDAAVTIMFAAGPKGETPNCAGLLPHIPKASGSFAVSFAELITLFGIAPTRLMALDAELEAIAKIVHDALVERGSDPLGG